MTEKISRCWRCGIDFDVSTFIEGAPCPDCQFDDAPGTWLRFDDVRRAEAERADRFVAILHKKRYSDSEIGEATGLHKSTVQKIRTRLKIPAHKFTGDEKWRDRDAVLNTLAERMRGQNYKQGWRKTDAGWVKAR